MWSNYHTHSHYCDGKMAPVDYADQARQYHMYNLGFSSHAPVPFDCKWCMKHDDLDNYLSTIDGLKSDYRDLDIYKSLEIDFIPEVISPEDFKSKLDYTIGSIHFVEHDREGRPWEIDGLHSVFLDGLEKIFNNDIRAAVSRYFELTRQMVSQSHPTIIGHLDKIKIQNIENKFFDENDAWYRDEIRKTLKIISEEGGIVEVNTRGLYQKKSKTTYPSPWILDIIRDLHIPVTLSSDAHHPADLVNQFEEAARALLAAGIKKITILQEGTWKPYGFNESGIIIT